MSGTTADRQQDCLQEPPFTRQRRDLRTLIVEDDERLRCVLVKALTLRGFVTCDAACVTDAVALLGGQAFDLLLLDVSLPDGRAFDVLDAVSELRPTPRLVAFSGESGPEESFRLAQHGVRAYLKKPFSLTQLESALERTLSTAPDFEPHLRAAVGLVPIRDLEQAVRKTMVEEALARTNGNRRAAAKALSISRELLQHILRKL